MNTSKQYDTIIVRGGSAGCVLANRLSAEAGAWCRRFKVVDFSVLPYMPNDDVSRKSS